MKNKDTKSQTIQQSKKLSTPASDVDAGVNNDKNKWDHSSGSTSSKTGTGRNIGRGHENLETDDGYQDSTKRKFSSSEVESEVDSEGYSSPSEGSSEDQSFSEDKSDSSERRSGALDEDEEE